MKLFTLGFTKKSAQEFFSALKAAGVERIVDVRLNNVSQLAGFAKRKDLEYFLRELAGIEYVHEPLLAPTQAMLDQYRKVDHNWHDYERRFLDLMRERHVEATVAGSVIENSCLLCSEEKPQKCHRRLVAEYLRDHWGQVEITHLG